jgi:hypothetical protein
MRAADLIVLADAYIAITGIRTSRLGRMAAGNDRVFFRLAEGKGCTAKTLERAADWFEANWPPDVPWPASVPRRCHCEAAE